MIRAPASRPVELLDTVTLISIPITVSVASDALLLPYCSFTMTYPMPGRFSRVLGARFEGRREPFTLTFTNVAEPEREPPPFQLALAVVAILSAVIRPPSKFTFDMLFWAVAVALEEVIAPDALLVALPVLPTTGTVYPFKPTVEDPP